MSILGEIDAETRTVLEQFGFEEERFEALRARVADGRLGPGTNAVDGDVEPLAAGDVLGLPQPGDDAAARAAGEAALGEGELGIVVLTGGMATRFGGTVKGLVEVFDGRSFLELKLAQAAAAGREAGKEVPVALMTSFATDGAVRAFVAEHGLGDPLVFSQSVSLRLERDGSLFRDETGRVSPYSPGHGDLLEWLMRSGTRERLQERGVRHVLVSNVDNLGARVDPVVLGAHLRAGRPVTAEVVSTSADPGGAPARVDGAPQILESPRFPAGFDRTRLGYGNVNTLTIDLDVLDRLYDLTWLYVEKEVSGRPAVQLERVYHELTRFAPTTFLEVPATGARGRFVPVKTPEDLEQGRDALRELAQAPPVD